MIAYRTGRSFAAAVGLWAATGSLAQGQNNVLVVGNGNNAHSVALADYYMAGRGIPASNRLLLDWDANDNADTCTLAYFNSSIASPVYAKIATLAHIDYIVLCRNMPIKIAETSGSVDSALAGLTTAKRNNPFAGRLSAFNSTTYGVYLVTRLDGWSWGDAFGLVDRGLASADAAAPFVFDRDPAKDASTTTAYYNSTMETTRLKLVALGRPYLYDTSSTFISSVDPAMGYISWGSTDTTFSGPTFEGLTFAPGAIAETLVGMSASNLRYPGGTQSQTATLIRNGITGVKGYVGDSGLGATARAQVLFPRYASGSKLADSFYAASPFMGWKDVVVGDPLCAPYAP